MSVGAHIKVEDSRWWFGLANVYKKKAQLPVPTIRETCPEYQAGFFSRLTFQWMALFMRVGYRRPLELNDIWDVNPSRSVPSLQEKLLASFERRKANGEKRLLTKALYDTFRTEFLLAGFCSLVVSLLQVLTPFSLRYLIQFASDAYMSSRGEPAAPPISHGVAWAIGITCMQIIQSLCFNHFLYLGMIVGGQSRAVLIALIFDKASQMSGRARAGAPSCSRPPPGLEAGSEKEMKWFQKRLDERNIAESSGGWSNGRITNLMSMDTSRIHHAAVMIHFLWTSPVCVLLALALLLVNISYSALPGIALLLLVLPLLAKGVQTMVSRRKAINTITDERVSLTQEMLNAMRFIKYFSWESIFLSRLADVRKREISRMRSVLAIRHVITAISTTMSTFATLLAFTIFALSHHELKSSLVFSSLSLFGALSMPLNQFPLWLGYVTDAMHSIERIEEFLLAEEAEDPVDWDFDNENAVVLKHASFVWEQRIRVVKDSNLYKSDVSNPSMKLSPPNDNGPSNSSCETQPFKLEDLNLKIGRNELVAVIGPVASGKSSLLAALAGDMIKTDGMITLGASRAFCSQSAWIQNATVRENIRFGEDSVSSSRQSNERRYKDILDACALRPDLETFPSGDRTELGEKGITISGGQKQRLNIARAIYSNADLILMDDPLSSVDAHVGQHIMDHAICGLMSQKSRILVTHQLNILHRCDRVVVLSEGKIVADGTFEHLLANNSEFQQMMATVAQEERQGMHGEYERHASGEERVGEGAPNERDALMQDEERAISSVRWSVYAAYVRASGTILNLPLILLLLTIAQGSHVVTGLWLSWWTSDNFDLSLSVYVSSGLFAVDR
jgi:ABC-type multidrug transport system fused ATPase/permease subunit